MSRVHIEKRTIIVGLLVIVVLVVGLLLLSHTDSHRTSKASSKMPQKMASQKPSSPLSQALRDANMSRTAKHLLPPSACTAHGAAVVTCVRPAFGVDAVTFATYRSINDLYEAYLAAIRKVSPGPFHANYGDCTELQTEGEVSWNHNFEHPRQYSLMQARMGRLSDRQAAGRVFCTFNGTLRIIWTQNDGHMLGILSGVPHANTWDWWKWVHHSIDLGGSSSMSMQP